MSYRFMIVAAACAGAILASANTQAGSDQRDLELEGIEHSNYTAETKVLEKLLHQKQLLLRQQPATVEFVPNDPIWRASLAHALHNYCESVLAQVPRNTAREDQWIDSETRDALSSGPG